jgi:hypothetical protein
MTSRRFESVIWEDVRYGRQSIVRLRRRLGIVDMTAMAETARAVLNMTRMRVLTRSETCKCLMERSGLNDTIVRKLCS